MAGGLRGAGVAQHTHERVRNEMVTALNALVPVYLLADDGKLYQSRSVSGRVNGVRWWLRFDAEGNSVLTIERPVAYDAPAAYGSVMNGLRAIGVCLTAGRLIREAGERTEYDATVHCPLPAALFRHGGVWQPKGGNCMVYHFGKTWG